MKKPQQRQLSRKQKRHQQRQEKKLRRIAFHQKKSVNTSKPLQKQWLDTPKQKIIKNKQREIKSQVREQPEENQQDRLIRLYESKLGVSEGKEDYNKIAKKLGYDDDLFDFLDGISKKVKMPAQMRPEDELNQEIQEQEDQFGKMFDDMENFNQIAGKHEKSIKKRKKISKKEKSQEYKGGEKVGKVVEKKKIQKVAPKINEVPELRKGMTRLFNKLSEGNLLLTFRQFLSLFDSNPLSVSVSAFNQLFLRFNLMVEKPLLHVLATNVAVTAALHLAYGNRLLLPLLSQLAGAYSQLGEENSQQQKLEVEELGYSKRFERKKNFITILSLFYEFGRISGDLLASLAEQLCSIITQERIQLLLLLLQRSGGVLRHREPSILKTMVGQISKAIQQAREKDEQGQIAQRLRILGKQLSDIKQNRRSVFEVDQRMGFLSTFLSNNVPKEVPVLSEIVSVTFKQLFSTEQRIQNPDEDVQIGEGEIFQQNGRELMELAKGLHLGTEGKRRIFVCLMGVKDCMEATQQILQLGSKNLQDAASVIVQVCTLEPRFNPYYALVASKIASIIPKFRLNLQYAIWDHLKLLQSYQLRRSSNLAKLMGRIICDSSANCSLSMLKFFPDLLNVNLQQGLFLEVFFGYFFSKVKRDYLCRLVGKLREQNNRRVKEGLREYLREFQGGPSDKLKLCRRLLQIQTEEEMEKNDLF